MALKNDGKGAMSSSSNQLHRSDAINNARGLQALGHISRINPESHPSTSSFPSNYFPQPMAATNPSFSGLPPPLPPKRNSYMGSHAYLHNRYSPVSSYFSPYSRYNPGYPGFRMSPYGTAPYGAGYGMSHLAGSESYNSFSQMAEESARPAFESIESVVEVVSSISMMLESTYHAVHSSYSAILGVVDQFSRLKDHFAQILSFLSILRWLRWMCLKVLYLLGARKENPSVDAAWDSAEKLATALGRPDEVRGSAWPFFMFLGLVVGAPWLMFKLLAKSMAKPKRFDPREFMDRNGKSYVGIAAYDFKATRPGELSFKAGEKLKISPGSLKTNPRGWYYVCNEKHETGLIPYTYLKAATSRSTDLPRRPVVPEQNVCFPNEVVSETETIENRENFSNSTENSVSELVEKSPADSKDRVDVVVDRSANAPAENPKSLCDAGCD